MQALETKLGYTFRRPALLENALYHSSYANEHRAGGITSNERLEFLGDAVLGFVTAEYLYAKHPDLPEGDLTRIRAALVCEESLHEVAQYLELGQYLKLGHGEELGGGRQRPSILADSGADLLMYGMGEHQITELAQLLAEGVPIQEITDIRGTCYLTSPENTPWGGVQCPDYAQVCRDKKAYAKATRQQYDQQDEITGKTVLQRHGDKMLVQNPPAVSLTQEELDAVYRLPYQRKPHPMYDAQGGVPGIEEVQFSIAHNRGCFGYCNFCSIALHQGRRITCRSEESILEEAKKITEMPNFKGYIHDVGGPTANFRLPSCKKQAKSGMCVGKKCLAPEPCKALQVDHSEYLRILRKLRKLPKVKRVFIRSGIKFD